MCVCVNMYYTYMNANMYIIILYECVYAPMQSFQTLVLYSFTEVPISRRRTCLSNVAVYDKVHILH